MNIFLTLNPGSGEQNLKHFSRNTFEEENSEAFSLENNFNGTTITKKEN